MLTNASRVSLVSELRLLLCHFICKWQNFESPCFLYLLSYYSMATKAQTMKVFLTVQNFLTSRHRNTTSEFHFVLGQHMHMNTIMKLVGFC